MALVSLDAVVLAPVDDLSSQVALEVTSLQERAAKSGEVRTYAGGRRRSVTKAGSQRSVTMGLEVIRDRPLLDRLASWQGQVLLLRDPRGRKVYGVYYDVDISENVTADFAQVTLTLQEITYPEYV